LSERDKELIKEELHNDCHITSKSLSKKVHETFHHYVCPTAVYNYEMKIGSFRHPDVVPLLTEEKKTSRVEFAKCHLNDRFSNVLFSDESYFPLFRQTKKVFVLADEEPPRIENPDPHTRIMFWGAISRKTRLTYHIFDAKFDTDYYRHHTKFATISPKSLRI